MSSSKSPQSYPGEDQNTRLSGEDGSKSEWMHFRRAEMTEIGGEQIYQSYEVERLVVHHKDFDK
jgi:hypothetical protein